jgi:crotonobetainyl-CoA:carnitine CoA-transferase CaiB-like acyl-CoA transferase
MALFDCGLMITAYYGLEALLMGEDPPRYGNAHPSIVPTACSMRPTARW